MLQSTHVAVGVATALAVLQPANFPECLVVTGIAACGSVISDIDSENSKIRKRVDWMLGCCAAVLIIVFLVQMRLGFDLTKYLNGSQSFQVHAVATGILLILCVIGKNTAHHSMMHSIPAGALFAAPLVVIFPLKMTLAFAIAFATHLMLDLLNNKGLRLFWPGKKRFCLHICASDGWVNRMLGITGTFIAINLFTYFTGFSVLRYFPK